MNMGGSPSSQRATHFQNENESMPDDPLETEEDIRSRHISISTKMVERLVEDATLAGGAAAAVNSTSKTKTEKLEDHKERILADKLRSLDEMHSQKIGLTVEEVKATAKRVEMRTAHMAVAEPVCEDFAVKLMKCYKSCDRLTNAAKCAECVDNFSKCVQEQAVSRLHARTMKDAMEAAKRTAHVEHARHHALKDLSIPPVEVPS